MASRARESESVNLVTSTILIRAVATPALNNSVCGQESDGIFVEYLGCAIESE